MTQQAFTDIRVRPQEDARPGRSRKDGLATAFASVLVGVDGTAGGRDAIVLGEALRDPGGRTTLAHVVVAPTSVYRNFGSTPAGRNARGVLEREAAATGASAECTGMFAPSVCAGLRQLVADHNADLLVVGRGHRGDVARLLRADRVPSGAARAVPVAVAPPGYGDRPPRQLGVIGVADDGSPESEVALACARGLAARDGAARVVIGPSADELIGLGDAVDLLVVGFRGRGVLGRALHRSTSARAVRSAHCPVLVVPARAC